MSAAGANSEVARYVSHPVRNLCSEDSMILAGDLGGTKANLGLFDVKAGKLVRVAEKRYATQKHSGLEEITADFLNGARAKITGASFGIAGPVVNNRVHADRKSVA